MNDKSWSYNESQTSQNLLGFFEFGIFFYRSFDPHETPILIFRYNAYLMDEKYLADNGYKLNVLGLYSKVLIRYS